MNRREFNTLIGGVAAGRARAAGDADNWLSQHQIAW
jgi:hypothetical protein